MPPTVRPDSGLATRSRWRFGRAAERCQGAGARVGALRPPRRYEGTRELQRSESIGRPMTDVDCMSTSPVDAAQRSVVVSIVSHRHGADVLDLLRDLARYAHSSVRRIVLTLNLPEPELEAEAAVACSGIELCIRRNVHPLGFGANHNAAFRACESVRYFAVLNPDVRLHADPFPELCHALDRAPRAACAYPRQVDAAGQACNPPRPVPTPLNLLRRYVGPGERSAADWVNAACMLFDADAYAKLGGFDAAYRLYCEDVDICLRLQLAGYELVGAEDASIVHTGRRSSHAHVLQLLRHVRSLLRLWGSGTLWRYRRWVRGAARNV